MEILKKHSLSLLVLLIIVTAIPLTVLTAQNQQTLTQNASEPTPIITSIVTTPPTANEQRRAISGTLVSKTDASFTLKDTQKNQTTINFLPGYTKIYQFPSAAEYTPDLIPDGIFMTGTVLVIPKEKSKSGNEELIGEIFHLPANTTH